ncbi:helix-turn-helix domain-containing protein [Streptomyces sp. NPDC050509]|uniref:helix-turn-helix domain-containing protein n=1 Tax=Streptomyces sp. NPDC050509 TaxID=3365620 RepID=UPI00378EE8AC
MTVNGASIRALRSTQKLGLRALAERTGLDRGYLSRVERGQVRRPKRERVQRIADALQVPPEAIDPEDPS